MPGSGKVAGYFAHWSWLGFWKSSCFALPGFVSTQNLTKLENNQTALGPKRNPLWKFEQLAKELKEIKTRKDGLFVSHDVISPLNIVMNWLKADRTLKKQTKLKVQEISMVLHKIHVLSITFIHNLLAKGGICYGTPVSKKKSVSKTNK